MDTSFTFKKPLLGMFVVEVDRSFYAIGSTETADLKIALENFAGGDYRAFLLQRGPEPAIVMSLQTKKYIIANGRTPAEAVQNLLKALTGRSAQQELTSQILELPRG